MNYRPVVDHLAVPTYLDPIAAALLIVAFAGAAVLTARRPAYGLSALIVVTPLAFARDIFATTVSLPKCVLLGVLVGLATYSGIARALRARPAALLLGLLILYALVTMLTLVAAAHAGPVFRETLKWAEYAALVAAAVMCYRLDRDDAAVTASIAIAAIVVAISALLQEIAGAPSGLYVGAAIVPRIAGLLEGPNQLSAYCAIVVAALGAWSAVRRSILLDIAIALTICCDVLTFSRAGLVGLALVIAILAIAAGPRAGALLRPAAAGVAVGLLGALWWAIYAHTPGILRVTLAPSAYAGGVGNRGELWRAALRMWQAHPLLGVGAGNYELQLPLYGVYGVRTHANSWYLQSLAEGGIVLFAATIALVCGTIGSFVRRPFVARLRAASPWVVAALAASVAMSAHNIVDDLVFYTKVGGMWWLLVGIAAAA